MVILTGWWFQPIWKKNISQLGFLFPIYGKIKYVPNHQPVNYVKLWKYNDYYRWSLLFNSDNADSIIII